MSELTSQRRVTGAFVHLETEVQQQFLRRFGWFSKIFEPGDPRWRGRQVGLLVEYGGVIALGVVQPSGYAATGLRQLRYDHRLEIEPVGIAELETLIPGSLKRPFEDAARGEGRLPPKTWQATLDALRKLRPNDVAAIDSMIDSIDGRTTGLSERALQVGAHERDAVGLALDIADFGRDLLREAVPDMRGSFLSRLGQVRAHEDPTISYDSLRFLDFDAFDDPSGVVRLVRGDEQLVVINVNRQGLETTLGADLIYIHDELGSVVFVQYKTMGDSLAGRPAFRPSGDQNFENELARMRRIQFGDDDGSPRNFRLSATAAFLKICSPVSDLRQHETGPISGLYLPLAYLEALLAGGGGRGPRGGVALNFDTVGRYMTNGQFAGLVRGGWIGSRGVASDDLQGIIIDAISADRSETLAFHSKIPGAAPRPAQPRARRFR